MAPDAGEARETFSVGEVCVEIRALLRGRMGGFWVSGEIQRARPSRNGHLYFELVEKGAGDEVLAKLEAVLWRRDHQTVARELRGSGQRLGDGVEIRCWAEVDFYAPFGRLQLVVRRVDPLFTLGLLEKRRRETLEALTRDGILDLNKRQSLPPVPLSLGLVTSEGSAAYHDFLSTLAESGYGFRVHHAHAAVQGGAAERELATALARLGAMDLDALVLVRGGGSRTDLAAFDSRRVAEAVARAPLPVITGLGHDIDESIADRVAHTATKTPTRAAELLVQTVAGSERAIVDLRHALARAAVAPVRRAERRLAAAERGLGAARFRVDAERRRLEGLSHRLGRGSERRIAAEKRRLDDLRRGLESAPVGRLTAARLVPDALAERISRGARSRLREVAARLDGWQSLCESLAPARTLARGFSVTRRPDGRLVRSPDDVSGGDRITTELAAGVLASRVEESR